MAGLEPSLRLRRSALTLVAVGVLLRLGLALFNRSANDDHLSVARVISEQGRSPLREELEEAFNPKLYHAMVAAVWWTLPRASAQLEVVLAQLLNAAAGTATLLAIFLHFRYRPGLSPKAALLAVGLVSLNPGLVAINGQATNDTFVILFGSLALLFGSRFFRCHKRGDFLWMTGTAIAAALSKGNGIVVFLAIAVTFLVSVGLLDGPRRTLAAYGAGFLALYLGIVPFAGPYWRHARTIGNPFVTNWPAVPLPPLVDKQVVVVGSRSEMFYRPGALSVTDCLLTFRLVDMLRFPILSNDKGRFPRHRTSLWSQLYGRAHLAQFDAWPPAWRLARPGEAGARVAVWGLGRATFLAALLPTALLVAGLFRRVGLLTRSLWRKNERPPAEEWLLDAAAWGYLAFIALYALRVPDFSVMKPIFIFPALLAYADRWAEGYDRLGSVTAGRPALRLAVDSSIGLLLILYAAGLVILIGHLATA